VTGEGLDDLSDFEGASDEASWDGWTPVVASPIGSYLAAVSGDDLPDPPGPGCVVGGHVMLASDPALELPHPIRQFESLRSNPISIGEVDGSYQGVTVEVSSWFPECSVFEPLYYGVRVQVHPFTCPMTGVTGWSPPRGERLEIGGSLDECLTRVVDLGDVVPPLSTVDSLRVVIEVIHEACISLFPCDQAPCAYPYWDGIRLGLTRAAVGVHDAPGTTTAPLIGLSVVGRQPTMSPVMLELELGTADVATVGVWSTTGRQVRRLVGDRWMDAGAHRLDWDLANDAGHRVAPGVYFVRVRTGAGTATTKVVIGS